MFSNNSSSEPNKTSGQLHSVKGNIVKTISNATSAQSWQQSSKEEHTKGEAEYDAACAKVYAEGAKDHVGGFMKIQLWVL
uniref:Putative mismatched base pair and cruciform DNA recognition protein n=1 Tax=Moniliophthora roreri TaxID=221103 RepID=A0A0W0FFI7_MONRR